MCPHVVSFPQSLRGIINQAKHELYVGRTHNIQQVNATSTRGAYIKGELVPFYVGRGLTSSTCISCSIGMRDSSPPSIGAGKPCKKKGLLSTQDAENTLNSKIK